MGRIFFNSYENACGIIMSRNMDHMNSSSCLNSSVLWEFRAQISPKTEVILFGFASCQTKSRYIFVCMQICVTIVCA